MSTRSLNLAVTMGIATILCMPMRAQSEDDAVASQLQGMKLMNNNIHSGIPCRQTFFCEEGDCATPVDLGNSATGPAPISAPRLARGNSGKLADGGDDNASNRKVVDPPTEFQTFVKTSSGMELPIYGASLSDQVPSTFAPVDRVPVLPDYTVGPGDELEVRVWEQINSSQRLVIDRTGDVFLPASWPNPLSRLSLHRPAAGHENEHQPRLPQLRNERQHGPIALDPSLCVFRTVPTKEINGGVVNVMTRSGRGTWNPVTAAFRKKDG
ncbi:MAG: polysaccharide biosynthesis/export family protein [Bryobacteraceae bacterium]